MCIVCGSGSAHLLRAISRSNVSRPGVPNRFSARAVAPKMVPPLDPTSREGMDGPADVILRGACVVTMDLARPEAAAVGTRAGRILAVGSEAEVLAHRGRLTRVIDLHGRALLPGLVDAHWPMPFVLLCEWLDSPSREMLRATLQSAMQGEWIVLSGTASLPDTDKNPVVLTDAGGAVLAGNALASAGGALPDHISELLPRFPFTRDAVRTRLVNLLHTTAATGVTCLRICGLGMLGGADDLDLVREVMETAPKLRLRATLDAGLLPEWRNLHLGPGFGDDMLRVDTLSAWPPNPKLEDTAGLAVTLHADSARAALDWFAGGVGWDARGGVELRVADDIADLHRLGLSAGLTTATASLLPAGGCVSLGMDSAQGAADPLCMIQLASAAGVTPDQALAAVTRDAAARCGAGAILGSLTPGKRADFDFFEHDPRLYTANPPRCTGTWVNGREAFRLPPHAASR